nr:MAG TPA: hypothetical protein [Caudoviricetes sp.]
MTIPPKEKAGQFFSRTRHFSSGSLPYYIYNSSVE